MALQTTCVVRPNAALRGDLRMKGRLWWKEVDGLDRDFRTRVRHSRVRFSARLGHERSVSVRRGLGSNRALGAGKEAEDTTDRQCHAWRNVLKVT